MSTWKPIQLLVALLAVLCPGCALSQQTGDEADSTSVPVADGAGSAGARTASSEGGADALTQYAASLDGTGLIALNPSSPTRLLFGATVAGGWDSNPDNSGNSVSSGLYTVSPYVGLQADTPKAQYLLQYQATNTFFTSQYAAQTMNVASLRVLSRANDRWSWDVGALASHGQDAIRFLGAQQTVVVGEVPGTGPKSASYLLDAGTLTSLEAAGSLRYRETERDTIELRVANAFTRYSGLHQSNSVSTVRLNYERDLSPKLGGILYEQTSIYYGGIACKSFGGGAGVRWHPREQTVLLLSGGPQLTTSSCASQQGYAFNVSFSTRLGNEAQVYLLSAREPTTSYLGPGLWQQSVSGGYQRRVTSIGSASVDLGYVASDTLSSVASYHGTYLDGIYSYRLSHGLRASYSYRKFFGNSGVTHIGRQVAAFSLVWTPASESSVR